jgi:hypothetical protein
MNTITFILIGNHVYSPILGIVMEFLIMLAQVTTISVGIDQELA